MSVSEALRLFRECHGLSYTDLTNELNRAGLDIDRMAVVRIEKGERRRFTEEEIRIIARVVGRTPNELVDYND
jgi:transcriptional regulator with XRE-family HTH domain